MADVRKQVLKFAQDSEGSRIWAQLHGSAVPVSGGSNKQTVRRLRPLVDSFIYRNQEFSCSQFGDKWKSGTDHIYYSDNNPNNNFRGKNKAAYTKCHFGVGECWDLAYAALDQQNALPLGITRPSTMRVWSKRKIENLGDIRGGEVIEFSRYYALTLRETNKDNSTYLKVESTLGIPAKHTAIIGGKIENGSVTTFNQNFGNTRSVHKQDFLLASLSYTNGNDTFYQACGGVAVKNLITQGENADSFPKLKRLRSKIKNYIRSHNGTIPTQVKVYIPLSRT